MVKNVAIDLSEKGKLFDSLEISAAWFDREGSFLLCNALFLLTFLCEESGKESWETRIESFSDCLEDLRARRFLPETMDFRSYKAHIKTVFAYGNTHQEDWHLLDGRTLRMQLMPCGETVILCFEDLTGEIGLKRKNNALVQKQLFFQNILREGVVIFGMDFRLDFINPACVALWGCLPECKHWYFEDFLDCIGRQMSKELFERLQDDLRTAVDARTSCETTFATDHGRISLFYAPLPDGGHVLLFQRAVSILS